MATVVEQLVAAKDIAGLIDHLENQELEIAAVGANESPSYTILILAYLIEDDVTDAKFVWKRIPDQFKQGKDVHAAWAIGKAMWNQDYKGVYEAIRAHKWNPLLQQLVSTLEDRFRQRTIHLISKAYTNVRLSDLAVFLGSTEEEARKFSESQKWAVTGNMVTPVYTAPKTATMPDPKKSLQSLTSYASYMETAQ